MSVTIRPAQSADCAKIMQLIYELAEYEKMSEQVLMTTEKLQQDMDNNCFFALVAEKPNCEGLVGYALYYYTYSTWAGRMMFLEDLYVTPSQRKQGIGKMLHRAVAKHATRENCCRLQWCVLDWNKPAIDYYKKIGGINLTEKEGWWVFRMTRQGMEQFIAQ